MIDLTTISPTTFAKGTQKGDGTITPLNIIIDTMCNHDEDVLSSYVESVESNAQGKTFKEYMKSVSDTESVQIFITRDILIEEIYTI